MSTISSVSSTSDPTQTSSQGNQSDIAQLTKNFQAIGGALQSGDVSTAQEALAALQQAMQGGSQSNSQTSSSQPFGKNTQANTDYQSLTSALQSGNVSDAQKAYASLQDDLKSASSAHSAHKGHHHHHSSSSMSSTTTLTTAASSAATDATVASDGSLNTVA